MNKSKQKYLEQTSTKPVKTLPKVALYHRVSSQKQANELTIKRQQSVTKEVLSRLHVNHPGAKLIAEYNDEAYNFEEIELHRSFWSDLIPKVKKREINTVIISSDDRIFRGASAEVRGKITDLFRKYNVRLITSSGENTYSLKTTSGRIVDSVMQEIGAVAKLETVKTLHSGRRRRLLEDNEFRLQVVPYGLTMEIQTVGKRKTYIYAPDPSEAVIVRDIFRLYLGQKKTEVLTASEAPLGAGAIADRLNASGVSRDAWIARQPDGLTYRSDWDKQMVLRMLTNPIYKGELTVIFKPTDKVSGYDDVVSHKTIPIPAIIADKVYKQTQTRYQQIRHKLVANREERVPLNWLQGLIPCQTCRKPLIGFMATNKIRYYKCPNSTAKDPHGMYRAEDLESRIEGPLVEKVQANLNIRTLKRSMSNLQKSPSPTQASQARLETELKDLDKKLKRLTEGYLDGAFSAKEFKSLKAGLNTKITDTKTNLDLLSQDAPATYDAKELKALFSDLLSRPDRCRLLRLGFQRYVSRAELKPKSLRSDITTYDPKTLQQLYTDGYLVLKDIREAFGWSSKKAIAHLGKNGRKKPIDWQLKIAWYPAP